MHLAASFGAHLNGFLFPVSSLGAVSEVVPCPSDFTQAAVAQRFSNAQILQGCCS